MPTKPSFLVPELKIRTVTRVPSQVTAFCSKMFALPYWFSLLGLCLEPSFLGPKVSLPSSSRWTHTSFRVAYGSIPIATGLIIAHSFTVILRVGSLGNKVTWDSLEFTFSGSTPAGPAMGVYQALQVNGILLAQKNHYFTAIAGPSACPVDHSHPTCRIHTSNHPNVPNVWHILGGQ